MYTQLKHDEDTNDTTRSQELVDEINTILRMLGRDHQRVHIKRKEGYHPLIVIGTKEEADKEEMIPMSTKDPDTPEPQEQLDGRELVRRTFRIDRVMNVCEAA